MLSIHCGELKQELLDSIAVMDDDKLFSIRQFMRLSSIKSSWSDLDSSLALPEDAITSVGSFLEARDLSVWQTCSRTMLQSLDSKWMILGLNRFCNVRLQGRSFGNKDESCSSWFLRYTEFTKALRLCVRSGVMSQSGPHAVQTCIPMFKKVSCTIPARFGISVSGSTFLSLTVSVKFSPEAVRSVIGLIDDVPSNGWGQSLECDRGLSRKHWGLAFGPLTGVVSCMGKYFDDFSTYRARHGLKDYLAAAMEETVQVRVGIFIDQGKVAFYRLPESDYSDWECTGFVYNCSAQCVLPAVMFSHIGHRDAVSVCIDGVSERPPFYPHVNTTALNNWEGWNSFADESNVDSFHRPPPNSPTVEEENTVLYD